MKLVLFTFLVSSFAIFGAKSESSWIIDIKNLDLSIVYNHTNNTLAFLNTEQQTALIYGNGKIGFFIIPSGAAIIASGFRTKVIKNITETSDLASEEDTVKLKAAGACAKYLSEPITLTDYFETISQLASVDGLRELASRLSKVLSEGANGLIKFVLGKLAALGKDVVSFVLSLINSAVSVGGMFLFGLLRNFFIFADVLASGIITSIRFGAYFALNFFKGGVSLFTVTAGGFVIIGNAVVGTVVAAAEALRQLIGSFGKWVQVTLFGSNGGICPCN